jgi:hypothetical protein
MFFALFLISCSENKTSSLQKARPICSKKGGRSLLNDESANGSSNGKRRNRCDTNFEQRG